ncbi:TRAP transporter small permease [Thalassospira sp.]|uniref:TRAP transporter small permease n=1 Tax=Thalassospira sp. TaxID=1912094 RepID=UPI0027356B6B|nr:TRAP transporter small permease [Thalassospira sp.]MDP2698574.1 TRAP transporter small permease [Thalassospira sp.]
MSLNSDGDLADVQTGAPNLLYRSVAWLNTAFLVISAIFVVLMMVHVTADVLLRMVLDVGITGTLEVVSYYYMVCAIFLAAGYVELHNEHIRVDLFVQQMPRSAQVILYVLACGAGFAFFGFLAWQSMIDAIRATQSQETIMSNFLFYIWPSRWALPVGFVGCLLAILCNLLKSLSRWRAL